MKENSPICPSPTAVSAAEPAEVVHMNTLTVNLHLMLATFYRPAGERFRIVVEDAAFPSDSHAVASQARRHGLDPAAAIVRLKPREGEAALRTEDVVTELERLRGGVALVLLGGVNYLTGELFAIPEITAAAHDVGALAAWDLAHAIGNVPLALAEWDVDWAVWCHYKYVNAGPGAPGGAFVAARHGRDHDLQERLRRRRQGADVAGPDVDEELGPAQRRNLGGDDAQRQSR